MNKNIIFINREEELKMLEKAYRSRKAELIIIYGRRRIGKTFLLSRFLKNKKGIYLVVNFTEKEAALKDLTDQLTEQLELPYPPKIERFSQLYRLIASMGANPVVIDEFQRLHSTGGVAELQSAWDTELSKKKLLLILAGSSVGMVEKIGLSHESPLYGRATRILKLKDFPYASARAFLQNYTEEDKVRTYAVFGGTPGYLALIDDSKTLKENIASLVLEPGAPLKEEPYFLLATELREPSRYIQIIRAIADGATKLGEIADKARIKIHEITQYMKTLEQDLDLVERRYPLLQEGARGKARYYLKNNFFKFWYSLVFPRKRLIELGLTRKALQEIWRKIDAYTSQTFEQIAIQHFTLLAKEGKVSFTHIGKWWSKNVEIDFIAIDEANNTAYFAECKWTTKPTDTRTLHQLIAKSQAFPWKKQKRKNIYVLYSRAGFTFKDKNTLQYSLKTMQKLFEKHKPTIQDLNTR